MEAGMSTFTERQTKIPELISLFLHLQRLLCHQNSQNGQKSKFIKSLGLCFMYTIISEREALRANKG